MEEKQSVLPVSEGKVEEKNEAYSEDFFADFDFSKKELTLEQLLKAGAHFGHQKSRRNPKMDKYIFTTRKGVTIIDLEQTLTRLQAAMQFLAEQKKNGKKILFVGTKKQSHDLIVSLAKCLGMPFMVDRWLGGTFTNFKVIKGRAQYLKESQEKMVRGEFKMYTKFERMKKQEELDTLEKKMGGIKEMTELPGAIVTIDAKADELAIREAERMKIPVVSITDTNVDPGMVDYPIPANDDAISSIRLILTFLGKAVAETVETPKAEPVLAKK